MLARENPSRDVSFHKLTEAYHDEEHEAQYNWIVYNVSKVKSLMRGISEGFYGNPDTLDNSECMNSDAVDAIYNLYEGFVHGNGWFDTLMKIATAYYVLSIHLSQNCRTAKFIYDATTYCFRSEQCDSFDIYLYNLSEHLYDIVLAFL